MIKKRVLKFFSGLIFYVSLTLLAILLILQLYPVQTGLARLVLEQVSDKTDFEINLSKVQVSWLNRAKLKELLVRDKGGDTLLYSRSTELAFSISNLLKDELMINEVNISDLRFHLIKDSTDTASNLTQFINSFKTEKEDTTSQAPLKLTLRNLDISDLNFSLYDQPLIEVVDRLDFKRMKWYIPDINVSDFELNNDTIIGTLEHFRGDEEFSDFSITEFQTKLRVTKQSLSLDDLRLQTPTSSLADSLEFFYNGFDDFSAFVDSVSFVLHFNNTKISAKDISQFIGKGKVKSDISLNGIIWGQVGDFNIEESRIGLGSNTFIEGGVSAFGLPDLENTFILADLNDATLDPLDLEPYLPSIAYRLDSAFGKIDFNGSFAGYMNDFVARADFYTEKGNIKTDINLKIPKDDPEQLNYRGAIELEELELDKFFKSEYIKKINLVATIDGHGITREKADFKMDAIVYKTIINGYEYDTLEADGRFSDRFFEGNYRFSDPNFKSSGFADIDFTSETEILQLDLRIDTINLDTLNFTTQPLSIKSKLKADVFDLDIDRFNGSLSIDSTIVRRGDEYLRVDSIRIFAAIIDSLRNLNLAFPGFEFGASGNFKISEVIRDIPVIVNDYKRKLKLEYDTSLLGMSDHSYKLNAYAVVGEISEYLSFFESPIRLGNNTFLEATYRQSKNSNLSVFLESNAIAIGSNEFVYPTLEINASKGNEANRVLTNVIFQSIAQLIPGVPPTEDFLVEAVWFNDTIDIVTSLRQEVTKSRLNIKAKASLGKDSIRIKMEPSDILLFDESWTFDEDNKILLSNETIFFSELGIRDTLQESLYVNGQISSVADTDLRITTNKLEIEKANVFTTSSLKGDLQSSIHIVKNASDSAASFLGHVFLEELYYQDIMVGDLRGKSEWNASGRSITSSLTVEREDIKTISIKGDYFPKNEEQLDFDILFDQAALILAQPFLEENFSSLEGYMNGNLKVGGSVKNPRVIGDFSINGGLTINYLNTHYTVNGGIDFNRSSITLNSIKLVDRKGSEATLRGDIKHSNFQGFDTDFKIYANNFEFLNTSSIDNSLYYGSAYGSGLISISGPFDDLVIDASVRTDKNTRFFIPVSESSEVSQESYISFVNFSDTSRSEEEDKETFAGLTMNFNLEVTPDAYCELIFDIRTGEIIKGRGRGNLRLNISKDGEFTMFGPLAITEGSYTLTVANLVSKAFSVIPDSKITWYGDPYNAILDLEATYTQRASLDQLDPPDTEDVQASSPKVPFLVVLALDGEMLSPDISFDIRFQNPSDATSQQQEELSAITRDEQELRRQFISLLMLKKFSPRESFALGSGGNMNSMLGEFLSNQMSYLFSQVDENLEVELDLASLDNESFNNLQLRLAYTFLDGRLKVTRGGDFGSGQEQGNSSSSVLTDIVGDWSVEYSLTKDGKLRAKVFQSTNEQLTTTDNQAQETGISVKFVHSFNNFMELLSFRRKEAIAEKEGKP